jgi:hypothetical protein
MTAAAPGRRRPRSSCAPRLGRSPRSWPWWSRSGWRRWWQPGSTAVVPRVRPICRARCPSWSTPPPRRRDCAPGTHGPRCAAGPAAGRHRVQRLSGVVPAPSIDRPQCAPRSSRSISSRPTMSATAWPASSHCCSGGTGQELNRRPAAEHWHGRDRRRGRGLAAISPGEAFTRVRSAARAAGRRLHNVAADGVCRVGPVRVVRRSPDSRLFDPVARKRAVSQVTPGRECPPGPGPRPH